MASTKADFSQRDPQWAGELLGFARWQTIGGYGCLVTAYANIAQAMGKDVTPRDVNRMFKDKNLFSVDSVGEKSDVSRADAISVVFPDIKYQETKFWPQHEVAPASYFDVRHTTKIEIIVMVDYHPEKAGVQTHYCRVIGTNEAKNDIEIVDSYTGKRIWLSSIANPQGKRAMQLVWQAFKFTRD